MEWKRCQREMEERKEKLETRIRTVITKRVDAPFSIISNA